MITASRLLGEHKLAPSTILQLCSLPCFAQTVPLRLFLKVESRVWLRNETHPSNSDSRERLETDISTFEPSGSGGVWTRENGLSSLVGWMVMVRRGDEPGEQTEHSPIT